MFSNIVNFISLLIKVFKKKINNNKKLKQKLIPFNSNTPDNTPSRFVKSSSSLGEEAEKLDPVGACGVSPD